MSKGRKTDFAPHVPPEKAKRCEHDGCMLEGMYKAPVSRTNLGEYTYLCLEHVREHNQKWDYFSGMDADEIEAFMKDAVTGHRPTWDRGAAIKNPFEKLSASLDDFLNFAQKKKSANLPHLPAKIKKALNHIEIDYPYTEKTLKMQYKILVKQYHPDHNPGDKEAEEKFKIIASAYKVLEKHIKP